MNTERLKVVENTNKTFNKLEIKKDFEPFINSGVSMKTFKNLIEKFLEASLKTYQETYEAMDYPRVSNEGNDEKLLTKNEVTLFINEKFQGNILQKALVSGIELHLNEINYQAIEENFLGLEKGEYYLPKEKFLAYFNKLSFEQQEEMRKNIYHAESFASWNRTTEQENETVNTVLLASGKVLPTPIALFNFEFDKETRAIMEGKIEEAGIGYLSEIKESEREKVYALGNIAHEIAHNIFQHLIYNKPQEKEWEEIVKRLGSVTKYAERYKDDDTTHYDENFAEAVRLFTTTREFLEKNGYMEMVLFIKKYFPEIKS